LLDKIRSTPNHILIGGIDPRLAGGKAQRRESVLFENLSNHNPTREFGRRENFLFFSAITI
jgi:hypothetical protein